MSFNSFLFLLVFTPITLLIYWMLKKKGLKNEAIWFLVLASLFFYGYKNLSGLAVLVVSLGVNYAVTYSLLKGASKKVLAAGIIFDILLLAVFKYGPLTGEPFFGIVTAPGISFYTFCEIALVMECYRGTVEGLSFREYSFLMVFFPKMIEGPIVRPDDILKQESGLTYESMNIERVYRLIVLFTLGCFKKVIIADTLGGAVDYGFTNLSSLHTGEALIVMLSYTLQLYFDFSGYCDMAMAIAGAFGFELPLNFDSPYRARNILEFWKKWHISLTTFFTRYLYIPLGGNRKGRLRTYINFLIVFLVSGLWHGAGWQFIIWGMMHGVLYLICRAIADISGRRELLGGKIGKIIATAGTFLYVNVAWVFFRAPKVEDAIHLFKDMGECWFPRFNYGLAKCFNIDELWYLLKILHLDGFSNSIYFLMFLILAILMIIVFAAPTAVEFAKKCRINCGTTVLITILFIWCILSFEGVATYLYVNF